MFNNFNRAATLLVDRRKFLAGAAGFIAAGLLPKDVMALAAPYNFKHGAFDVTVVSDGELMLPWTIIAPDAPPEELKKLLATVLNGDKVTGHAKKADVGSGPINVVVGVRRRGCEVIALKYVHKTVEQLKSERSWTRDPDPHGSLQARERY